MPTFDTVPQFSRDLDELTPDQRRRFKSTVNDKFVPDLQSERGFRPGLRVKRVQGTDHIWEMTWAPNGRATFRYGEDIGHGAHVIWLRVGTHDILKAPAGE